MTLINTALDVQFEGDENAPVQPPIFIRAVYSDAFGPVTGMKEHVWVIEWADPTQRSRACNHRDKVDESWLKAVPLWMKPGHGWTEECKQPACQIRFKAARA